MKGVIVQCLKEMVVQHHGAERWDAIGSRAGMEAHAVILSSSDMPDEKVVALMHASEVELKMGTLELADAFGVHWNTVFAPRVYASTYRDCHSAREFLLKLDDLHTRVTRTIPNARPPRFEYRWENPHTLVMTYISHRKLVHLAVGLARGLGRYFKETLVVERLGESQVRVRFPAKAP